MQVREQVQGSQEEIERVRAYLLSQAANLRLPELVSKVRRDSWQLRDAALVVPVGRFGEPPAAGEWSAAQVTGHVLSANATTTRLILDLLERGAASSESPAQDRRLSVPPASGGRFWEPLRGARERLYARVLRARGDEHLDARAGHFAFGGLNWREWLLFLRVHDLDHARQLQAIGDSLRGRP